MSFLQETLKDANKAIIDAKKSANEIGGEFSRDFNKAASIAFGDLERLSNDLGFDKGEKYMREKRQQKEMGSTNKLHEKAFLKIKYILENFASRIESLGERLEVNVEKILESIKKSISRITDHTEKDKSTKHRDSIAQKYRDGSKNHDHNR